MYRIWYSTESFADYIIDHTVISQHSYVKNKMYESDANNPQKFHTTPDHIRKILYLDAPDLIVEKDNEPIFSIEITTEAGTGHNAFQRFARIAASVENSVPAFYIYPEGAIITRKSSNPTWDKINPLVFKALEAVMSIYQIPALLYYYPSDIQECSNPLGSPNYINKGLRYDPDIARYPGCPDASTNSMQKLFLAINEIINNTERDGIKICRERLLSNLIIREQREYMATECALKTQERDITTMSPLSAVTTIPTSYLLNYLSQYESNRYNIGELLRSRDYSEIYQINARFRGDPYPGALAAIDYLKCREGKTFEDRRNNLIIVFGLLEIDHTNHTLHISNQNSSSINDFFKDVKNAAKHNLLTKIYNELKYQDISRYFMQVRYGSTYSKVKHIRVFSYFADAILFPDGSLWRDA